MKPKTLSNKQWELARSVLSAFYIHPPTSCLVACPGRTDHVRGDTYVFPPCLGKSGPFLSSPTPFAVKYKSARSRYTEIFSVSGTNSLSSPKVVMVQDRPRRQLYRIFTTLPKRPQSTSLTHVGYRPREALILLPYVFLLDGCHFIRQDCIRPIQKQHIFQDYGRLWPFTGRILLIEHHKRTQKCTKSLFVSKNADDAHKSGKTLCSVLS